MAQDSSPTSETDSKRTFPWIAAVLLVTACVFTPALFGDFTADDRSVALGQGDPQRQQLVSELRPAAEYLASPQPVATWTHALRHVAVGEHALAAHLINLLLHVAATALVYGLLRGLFAGRGAAAVGTLFFGLHAIHSEVVASVAGRAELLAFCGGAGALWLLVRYRHRRPAVRGLGLALAMMAMFAAVGSQETAAMWLPFAALYGLARRWAAPADAPRSPPVGSLPEALALLLPTAAFFWLRVQGLGEGAEVAFDSMANPIHDAPLTTRLLTGTVVWGYGLWLTLAPLWLSADYGAAVFPIVEAFDQPAALLSLVAAIALLGVTLMGAVGARRRPSLCVGVAAFVLFGAAVSNLVVPVDAIFAERSYYAPSLALAFVVAWLAPRISPARAPLALMAAGVWLGASTLTAIDRQRVWRDDATLVLSEIVTQPNSARMHLRAARVLADRGQVRTAIHELEHAITLVPDHAPAWKHLGDLYWATDLAQAAVCYEQALKSEPDAPLQAAIRQKLARLPASTKSAAPAFQRR